MASHLYIEIQFICISFFAVMLYRIVKVNDRRTSQLYLRVLVICGIACFSFDLAQCVVANHDPLNHLGLFYFFLVMYYLTLGALAYFWFIYSECEQDSPLVASSKSRLIAAIPFAVLGLITLTAPFNHALFYIDEHGVCVRGALHFVQVGICFLYMLATSIKAFVLAQKAQNYETKNRLRITGSLIIPTVISGALQVVWPTLPILCAGCCDSLLFGYLAMQEQHTSVDPLTKVGNRRRMIQHLEGLITRASEDHTPFGLLIVDADKFKVINDTYGHVEGDNALIHIAHALTNVQEDGLRVYRYGGDEFIVTSEDASDEALSRIARKIQEAVATEREQMNVPYDLSVSVGYTKFELTDVEPSDIVNRADSKLYEEKRVKHSKPEECSAAA